MDKNASEYTMHAIAEMRLALITECIDIEPAKSRPGDFTRWACALDANRLVDTLTHPCRHIVAAWAKDLPARTVAHHAGTVDAIRAISARLLEGAWGDIESKIPERQHAAIGWAMTPDLGRLTFRTVCETLGMDAEIVAKKMLRKFHATRREA